MPARWVADRVLVVMPNWIGDVVLATPALAAVRRAYAGSRLDVLIRPYALDVLAGLDHNGSGLFDAQVPAEKSLWQTAGRLRGERYDLAVLLPNSFKAALVAALGRCRRRVGFDRDGRRWLLTDRVAPQPRGDGDVALDSARAQARGERPRAAWRRALSRKQFAIRTVRDSYLDLATAVGCEPPSGDDRLPILATTAKEEARAEAFLNRSQIDQRPFAVLNPGAAFGASKLWPAGSFAQLARRLSDAGVVPLVTFGPAERAIAAQIQASCAAAVLLDDAARSIGAVKALVRRCTLMVTNDTGPRHFAIAFRRPVITLFGPTEPRWTETGYAGEQTLIEPMPCGPCQQKVCPLGTQACMTSLSVERVWQACTRVLSGNLQAEAAGAVRLPLA